MPITPSLVKPNPISDILIKYSANLPSSSVKIVDGPGLQSNVTDPLTHLLRVSNGKLYARAASLSFVSSLSTLSTAAAMLSGDHNLRLQAILKVTKSNSLARIDLNHSNLPSFGRALNTKGFAKGRFMSFSYRSTHD